MTTIFTEGEVGFLVLLRVGSSVCTVEEFSNDTA
jgi:hypothetical protein